MVLFSLGALGFIACLVVLLVKTIRRKPKKKCGIATGIFLVMGIAGMIYLMSTPAIEVKEGNYTEIMSGKMNDELIEIRGDITNVKNLGQGLYFIQMKASDGDYELYTTEDVAGHFPHIGDKRVKAYVTPSYGENEEIILTAISFPQ